MPTIKTSESEERQQLLRVTAWVPRKKLQTLMKEMGSRLTRSEVLRMLIDNELERVRSWKAHQPLYGIARSRDLDDRLL